MKTKYLLIAFLFICLKHAAAQNDIQWQKSLGGSYSDNAYAIQQTTDGGYIVAGYSTSIDGDVTGNHGGIGYFDYWIVKVSSAGNIQWQKSLGGSGDDEAFTIDQTTDGGYIVAGQTESTDGDVTGNHGGWDYWIVKLDSAGNMQWQKSLGGSGDDEASGIQQTTDGGYIVEGTSNSTDGDVTGNHGYEDYWIVKLSSAGNIQWQKCLGSSWPDYAVAINQTIDGGYIVTGYATLNDGDVTGNHGGVDYWTVKLNSVGNIQWQKCLGGSSGNDYASAVEQTTDGGYIVAGISSSTDGDVTGFHGVYDYWIVKLDSTGIIQWQKCLGGSDWDEPYSIQQTTDGGYVVAGKSRSTDGDVTGNPGGKDYWIVKLDSAGNMQWQKALGGSGDDEAYSIQQTTDGGYIVAGWSLSSDGDATGNHGGHDYWIVKLSVNTGTDEPSVNGASFSVFPNPSNGKFILSFNKPIQNASVKILNTLGEEIYNESMGSDIRKEIDLSAFSGIYFVKVCDGEREYAQKLIVE